MSITEGIPSANFRYNNQTGIFVPSEITDERQTVAEFTIEFPGYYGFNLYETPQTDIEGITEVKRVSDNQVFTHTNLATIGLTEYFFDYSNDMPTLFFNSANDGEEFAIKYYGLGGAVTGSNIIKVAQDAVPAAATSLINSLAVLKTEYFPSILSKLKSLSQYDRTFNSNVTFSNGIGSIRNGTVSANCQLYSNSSMTFGILELYGDLTVNSGVTLTLGCLILIVHGDILGSGTIKGVDGSAGGDGRTAGGGGGGGGGGTSLIIICFGTIASTINLVSGKGGAGGLANQGAVTAGASGFIDHGAGAGGTIVNAASNGGSGGGGRGAGGNGANGGTTAATNGNIGSGGGGGSNSLPTPGTAGINYGFMSAGGAGGTGGGSAANGQGGTSGYINVYSQYSVLPCNTDVAAISGGTAGLVNAFDLTNQAGSRYGLALITGYGYFTKIGVATL